jgi:hypothetical protein
VTGIHAGADIRAGSTNASALRWRRRFGNEVRPSVAVDHALIARPNTWSGHLAAFPREAKLKEVCRS